MNKKKRGGLNKVKNRAAKNPFDMNAYSTYIDSPLLGFMGKTNSINTRVEDQIPKRFKLIKMDNYSNKRKK